ncbi:stage II sporulation protein M [Chloroflexota bacterium]
MSYKKWFIVTLVLCGFGVAFGFIAPVGMMDFMLEDIDALQDLSVILLPFQFLTVILIWLKNATAMIFSFILSPVLCLIPLLALLLNGWILGFISAVVLEEESLGFLLAGLLPHGVFELPAFFIAETAALSFGSMVVLSLFKREKRSMLVPLFRKNLKYLVVSLILLVPAAIVETYITPLLIS